MAQAARLATSQLSGLLRADDGVNAACAALTLSDVNNPPAIGEIIEMQAPAELSEKAGNVKYPVIHVYCDRIVNSLKEKFRTFSGTADLNIEVRVSHDHLDQVQSQLQFYVQGITDVLDRKRGQWTNGMYYTGGYEIVYSPAKRGGRNYIQSARVQLQVNISLN